MLSHRFRGAVLALMVVALPASAAHACGCGRGLFGSNTTYYAPYTARYAPYVANYAPAGCGQVVNYMPQTYYRTVYVNAPVMAYSPVTACNACGGATTVMRPVTTYVTAARLVPYTTYSPVVTAMAPACGGGCGAVAPATAYYAPAAVAPAAPACCGTATHPQRPATPRRRPAMLRQRPAMPARRPLCRAGDQRNRGSQPGPTGQYRRAADEHADADRRPFRLRPRRLRSGPSRASPTNQPESRVIPPRDDSPNSNASSTHPHPGSRRHAGSHHGPASAPGPDGPHREAPRFPPSRATRAGEPLATKTDDKHSRSRRSGDPQPVFCRTLAAENGFCTRALPAPAWVIFGGRPDPL